MRLLIDGGGYTTATSAFGHANHAAALRCDSLSAALAGYAAMAGDSSSSADFAETYDAAAADGLAALADLADSFAGLGRLTHGSHQNHRAAEGLAGLDDVAYTGVRPIAPPSSLGGDPSGLPDTLNWLLDHVEAFIWPDADVDRLRAAGATWRGAAGGLAALVNHCDLVVSALGEEHSPEIPLALDAVRTLKGGTCDLAEQYVAIAGACEQYADQVEQQRAAMLDFLFDLLRDSLIIEGIGIGLSFVTAGGTAAGATAINIARVGAEMPRILQFVEAVRTAAAAAAAVMRSAGEIVLRARSTFGRFAGLVLASDARALAPSVRLLRDTRGLSWGISLQRQERHLFGSDLWIDRGRGGYFHAPNEAQAVLDAVHDGSATILCRLPNGGLLVRYDGITGFNNNAYAGYVDQPTHMFMIKGTAHPSVVPVSPATKVK
ncbi:WXG100-like domain-containing protein [Nocardioides sp. HB32]